MEKSFTKSMETVEAIMTRCSIRNFSTRKVSDEDVRTILSAGMAAPTAVNSRDFHFTVVRDRAILEKMADANGRAATPLKKAAFGVLVSGDLNKAYPRAKSYWIVNCAAATENMIIAARSLGIGSVWIGTWPQKEKVEGQQAALRLPENLVPHSIVAFGYPEEGYEIEPRADRPDFDESVVNFID